MKRVTLVFILTAALTLFTGCKQEVQKEFSNEMIKQSNMNAGDYSLEIDNLSITAEDADAPMRTQMDMVSKMINGSKVSGSYQLDDKEKLLSMNMNVEMLGQKIPVDFLMNQKNNSIYLNTNFMTKAMELAKEFNSELPIDQNSLESLKGKYIKITDEDVKKNSSNQLPADQINENLNSKLFIEYINTLDSNSFEKKENKITRTFTKNDIKGFVNYVNTHGNKTEKKEAKELKKNLNILKSFKQKMVLDTKKHTQNTAMDFSVQKEEVTVSAKVKVKSTSKEAKEKLYLPKMKQVVSMQELEKKISSVQESEYKIPEEDFNELLEGIKNGQLELSQEQIDQIKEEYQSYLSEQQYKQLEEVLDQVTQEAA